MPPGADCIGSSLPWPLMQAELTALFSAGQLPFANPPELLRQLRAGRSNTTWLIKADAEYYIAQDKTASARCPGVEPQREQHIMQQASQCGLAPAVVYYSPERHILITEYMAGRHWQRSDAKNKRLLERLLHAIQQLQALDSGWPALDYAAHIDAYFNQLQQHPSPLLVQQQQAVSAELAQLDYPAVLSHHDLNAGNILLTDTGLVFLDWEYAAPGWSLFDLATVMVECGVSVMQLTERFDVDRQQLQSARRLYSHLCDLWRHVCPSRLTPPGAGARRA